ncbi:unnamed protein product [Moneuplotes crassus]|uniref:Uncharacterized protein n=1 Tax=Euplotes crassus TaxID=5936 RepID=A0AAD1U9P8_EUPCR|nr:unnamed protein product [Moneuplotes crassus]
MANIEDHITNLEFDLNGYKERLRSQLFEIEDSKGKDDQEYKAIEQQQKWCEVFEKIPDFSQLDLTQKKNKLKIEWIHFTIKEAELHKMPESHPRYCKILEFYYEYEDWVMKYMEYSQQTSKFEPGYLSKLVDEAKKLPIETSESIKTLEEDSEKFTRRENDCKKLIDDFYTLCKGEQEITDLETFEEKLQSLLDESVSIEYQNVNTQLQKIKWLIKIYNLVRSEEQDKFQVWQDAKDSDYAFEDKEIPFLCEFYSEYKKADIVYQFVKEVTNFNATSDCEKIKLSTLKAHLCDISTLRVTMDEEKQALEVILKDYEYIDVECSNMRAGMTYMDLCKLAQKISKFPIELRNKPQKVTKKKQKVEEVRQKIRDEKKRTEKIRFRRAKELIDEYHQACCVFIEGEELKTEFQKSSQIVKDLKEKINTTQCYKQEEIKEMQDQLKSVAVHMGRDEDLVRRDVWRIRTGFVLDKIKQHSSFVKVAPKHKLKWKAIEILSDPPDFPPVTGTKEYNQIRKVYEKIKRDVIEDKIKLCTTLGELRQAEEDLQHEIICFSQQLQDQKEIIKHKLEETFGESFELGRSAALDIHDEVDQENNRPPNSQKSDISKLSPPRSLQKEDLNLEDAQNYMEEIDDFHFEQFY